ncbi:protein of unknown function DUF201 [Desulfofarcimen acetoxidans DSM 771]|uniref:ATP-grasp domain-containing protein n=1 Tax=Desulfofarcimen acetoxidans (strain ATCC 49208 / DSM 771 / KCTC 5769 / VKM B-1644 / 5575) TaxID=485916 RepID=C8W4F1_DESAS|nr:ATP-grasp domain-containing protein [Desulfofarcimen acetoxidans]ACV62019.1 protein of unknown function DUF201 [Desulfofarcimen acetoxidans DSM 771]
MDKIKVLITGSGSLYGVAVIRALLASQLNLKLVACDMEARALGLHLAHSAYLVPAAQYETAYLERLLDILIKEDIQAVFIASSKELHFFSKYKAEIEAKTKAKIFTNSPEVLNTCDDKWYTIRFLQENNFYFPLTIRFPEDAEQLCSFIKKVNFPVIIKPRRGTGSKGLCKIENFTGLRTLLKGQKDMIIQQYLPDHQGEYTTGICAGKNGKILSGITLKRYLHDGMTVSADSTGYTEITAYCQKVAAVLKPYGPCNFQLRLREGKPFIFEINPRFSSTTGMRFLLGVNEAEIMLKAELLNQAIPEFKIKKCSVIRQYADYLVPTEQLEQLENKSCCIFQPG